MAALGLPAAMLLGILADLVAGLVRDRRGAKLGAPLAETWLDVRRLVRGRQGAGLLEAGGAFGALLGAGLVSAACLGAIPGSVALVYLALALAGAGAHLAAAVPITKVGAATGARLRRQAAMAEVAVVIALGAAFLRWSADGLGAVWGAQEVLGTGFQVGPPAAAIGLVVAAAVLIGAGALRLPPVRRPRERGWPAGSALFVRVSRWGASGAMVLLVAALLVGRDVVGGRADPLLIAWGATALGAAVLLGACRAWLDVTRGRTSSTVLPAVLAAAAAGAMALVALG